MSATLKKTVTPAKRTQALVGNFKKYTQTPHDNLVFIIDEKNVGIWHILIRKLDEPFKNGEYIVRIEAPKDYPFGPPEFYFLTPNGVYKKDARVCIDIGAFHKDAYPATLGMGGFSVQLVSGLIAFKDLTGGVNVERTTDEQKRMMANDSVEYNNKNYPELMAEFKNSEFY